MTSENSIRSGIATHACRMHLAARPAEENKGTNRVWSPLNVTHAMAMLYPGAASTTADALREGCNLNLEAKDHAAAFPRVVAGLQSPEGRSSRDGAVQLASRVWTTPEVPLLPEYLATVEKNYGSSVGVADFSNARQAASEINAWSADKTGGRIKELVSSDDLSTQCKLVLTSAIHFKGAWQERFYQEAAPRTWTFEDGHTAPVSLMECTSRYSFMQTPTLDIVDVPFRGNAFAMRIFVPRGEQTLEALEDEIDATALTAQLPEPSKLRLSMPQFEVRTRIDMKNPLTTLGAGEIFSDYPNKIPDFSKLSTDNLRVSKVLHQAFITVDEIGAEAAAATAVAMRLATCPAPGAYVPPPKVRVDRSFLFTIHDGPSRRRGREESAGQTVLFMGRVDQPTPNWTHISEREVSFTDSHASLASDVTSRGYAFFSRVGRANGPY